MSWVLLAGSILAAGLSYWSSQQVNSISHWPFVVLMFSGAGAILLFIAFLISVAWRMVA